MADQTFTSGQILTAAQMSALQSNIGLVPITPTSVAGTNVTLSGNVVTVAASATNVSLNGVFTTAFTNYCAIITGTSTTELNLDLRLRASGSDLSTNAYLSAVTGFYGAVVNNFSSNGVSSMQSLPCLGTRFSTNKIDFFSPFTASTYKTAQTSVGFNTATLGMVVRNGAYTAGSATLYDGFTLVNGGTISCTITVYGYR